MSSYQTDAPLPRSARTLLLGGSAVRIGYGAAALLAPERMVAARLAPDAHALADPRLTLRAFGGHLLVVGGMTLAATRTRSRRLAASAAALSMLIDAFDVTSAALEIRARGRTDPTLSGGIALSGSGVLTFALALRALQPAAQRLV